MQVSFIIPVLDQLALTQACLASLKSTLPAGLAHEIILVDDGSGAETREFLRALPPPHVVLFNDRNLGYAAANNRAARVAQGEFLALLNNDLVLTPGWLEPMLAAFAAHPRAGVVGNIQLAADTGEVDHAGMIFRDGGYPIHHRESVAAAQARGALVEFPLVTAACCLVRREWFVRTGGFDESYKNGFEDSDLCLRAREDGFVNLLATTSVIRHHISRSSGRGAHEYRNAEKFLARWGPRSAALEKQWALDDARAHAAREARRFFAPILRRVGFGPAALRRRHRAALLAEQRHQRQLSRPIRVGIDLLRLAPGGANGGIKPLLYSFLTEIGRQRGATFNFAVIAEPALRAELAALLRPGDYLLELTGEHLAVFRRDPKHTFRPAGRFALGEDIPKRAQLDVLYAPFGVTQFFRPGVPLVSLIVDLLHRDLPAALPIEEINYRDHWFARVTREATAIQCISRHVVARLGEHFGVHPARCFHTYIPAQNRLPAPAPDALPPPTTPAPPYFFYPANFWPHKNHETLLVAYRLYAVAAGARAWPLVLTGAPDARQVLLEEIRDGLGLREQVQFLGHVDDAAFAALWSRAGALVFPSLSEGFGIPLLEAMRFGVPIIASNTGSIPEVAADAALLVDATDPRALAEALRRVAIREGAREDLVARGRIRLNAFSLPLEAGRLAHALDAAARHRVP